MARVFAQFEYRPVPGVPVTETQIDRPAADRPSLRPILDLRRPGSPERYFFVIVAVPVLFAVDEDADLLADVERELVNRYSRSYRIIGASSIAEAMEELEALAAAG